MRFRSKAVVFHASAAARRGSRPSAASAHAAAVLPRFSSSKNTERSVFARSRESRCPFKSVGMILTKMPPSLPSIQCLGAFKRFKCFFGPRGMVEKELSPVKTDEKTAREGEVKRKKKKPREKGSRARKRISVQEVAARSKSQLLVLLSFSTHCFFSLSLTTRKKENERKKRKHRCCF